MSTRTTKTSLTEQLSNARRLIDAYAEEKKEHEKTIKTLEERVSTLTSQRDAMEMRGNAASATAEGVREALIEAQEALEKQRHYKETAYKQRDRHIDRAAASNKRNGELQKALRKTVEEKKRLQLLIDADSVHHRKLEVAQEALRQIRDLANTVRMPRDEHVADVPVEELLKKQY